MANVTATLSCGGVPALTTYTDPDYRVEEEIMARIRLLPDEELGEGVRERVAAAEAAGADASPLRGMAQHQAFFDSYNQFYFPAHNGGLLEPELKELVRLKIARLNDCFT